MPPLSVQELLAKQSQGGENRPRFVSKKEREAHRAAEQEATSRAEADRIARLKRARAAWEQAGPSSEASAPPPSDPELSRIKQQYLGTRDDRGPRRPKRARDASKKFHFEWDADDDTSDPSLAPAPAAALLQGRAGLDGSERTSSGRSTMKSTLDEKPWSEKSLGEMKARDWRIFREDFQIQARGGDLPNPLRSWRESTIPAPVLEAIEAMGYREPTPIQRQAIPIGLEPRDLIGIAETGSGKTASFVVPMLAHVQRQPRLTEDTQHLGPYALILAPTRELAQQIETETRKFAARLGFRVVSLVGGRDLNEQAFYLNDGAEIVIATPGRLQDCLERHILVLGQCHFLVMDEADRMVDMNYEEALHYILASLPSAEGGGRITMLYSATMPPTVESIARTYLRRPATVIIGQAGQAVGTVEQRVEFVDDEAHRQRRLLELLDSGFGAPMIVFVNQKANADLVGRDLRRAGWHVAVLHSGLSQPQREAAIASLREGRNEVLCCTDIGARGIDLPDVSLVVNYQFPTQFPSYIHRIGRTGRAGKQGCAVSFVNDDDAEHFYELRLALSKSPVSTVPAELAQHPAALQRSTS
ncbi:RNA helicase [Malassezia caprae]|uniref:RNA helicase n=1 Tax=Malassezia caprae TaxID=1381934 RepID=A0AAF0E8M8_9BASI|nr:RNA helicase [Malassezia caprae]